MTVTLFGGSDIGRVRRINEDSFRLIPECETMVVCDGMGGHAAGEVASQNAVDAVATYLLRSGEITRLPSLGQSGVTLPPEAEDLIWAVRLANRRVFQTAQAQKQTRGMGTTLVAVRIIDGRAAICHVGDSRAYLFRNGVLHPLTIDHSLVAELLAQNEITPEQARTFPDRNIITRALGTRPVVAVDLMLARAAPGDLYLICSDGLCGAISDDDICDIISRHAGTPDRAIDALIEAANQAGGHDNITVAIARVDSVEAVADGESESVTIAESDDDEIAAEQELVDSLFDDKEAATNFVEEDTGKIAIRPPQS